MNKINLMLIREDMIYLRMLALKRVRIKKKRHTNEKQQNLIMMQVVKIILQ